MKEAWNGSDGTVYPSGCIKRKPKVNSNAKLKNTKLNSEHTAFLIEQIDKYFYVTITDVSKPLCSKLDGLSISTSAVRNHMVKYCKASLKNVIPYDIEKDSDRTIQLRFEFINAWKAAGVDYMKNCVCVDEAGFNSHQTRRLGWSKVGKLAVAKVPKNKGVNISIIDCITSWGILNFCKADPLKLSDAEKIEKEFPLPDNKKKRKANVNDEAYIRKISKGTTVYHVVKFMEQTMDILDQQGKRGVYRYG